MSYNDVFLDDKKEVLSAIKGMIAATHPFIIASSHILTDKMTTSTTMTKKPLSKSDTLILSQVFNPEALPSAQNQSQRNFEIDPSLPPDRHITSLTLLAELKAREKQAILLIEGFETQHVQDSATGNVEKEEEKKQVFGKAHGILTRLIEEYPEYASAYNNRAQVLRWFHSSPNSSTSSPSILSTTALSDLQTAITLTTSPSQTLSPQAANLLAQAHTSLGAIYHQSQSHTHTQTSNPGAENLANQHFALGAQYGNEVARAMSIQTNPHAKLCGEIVREAMRKEIEGAS